MFRSDCEYQAKREYHVKQHEAYVHDIDVKWQICGIDCEFKAKTKVEIRKHLKMKHSDTTTMVVDNSLCYCGVGEV